MTQEYYEQLRALDVGYGRAFYGEMHSFMHYYERRKRRPWVVGATHIMDSCRYLVRNQLRVNLEIDLNGL